MLFITFIILAFCFTCSCYGENASCATWDEIQTNIKLHDEHSLCAKEKDCSGMNCSGSAYGYNISAGIKLNICDERPSLSFSIDIPLLGVSIAKKTVHDGDYILLKDNLRLEFVLQTKKNEFTFGMFAHFVNEHNHSILDMIPMRIPIFQHISVLTFPCTASVTEKSTTVTDSAHISSKPLVLLSNNASGNQGNCSITNSSCNSNELCLQIDKMHPFGICICISEYERNANGVCIYHPSSDSTTESPKPHSAPNPDQDSNVSLLLTAILVPIAVILILVGIVYITIKFRVCQHLRRRLRVQVYEHVLLGQDEEEEETETESPNPVV